MSVQWVFDPAPPSGARKGGNAAEYGFEGRIDVLVRETVQNSMDAGDPWGQPVDVRFRILELTGDHMASFLEAVGWEALEDNLRAVPERRGGSPIHRAIAEMYAKDRLLLLAIEDRGTDGLTGNEIRVADDEINRFSALVRDELYSDKDASDAGGSYGLGKILLWAYSAFKTVLFSSVPRTCPDGRAGLRFIGRTSLPYHETDVDGRCAGAGWLGVPRDDGDGRHAVSVWSREAVDIAERCVAGRAGDDFGLTTVIVGFEEPGQETRAVGEIVDSIREAALESFWPALARGHVRIAIAHERDGETVHETAVDPLESPGYAELASLLGDYDAGRLLQKERLDAEGDAALQHVLLEVPKRLSRPGHEAFTGRTVLLVKLIAEDRRLEAVRDTVSRFRRPGMIVRQSGGRALSISARPYVAVLLCGRASGDGEEEQRIEQFLRAAEPPEHDRWQADTRAVKDSYQTWGVAAKLGRFEKAVLDAVRRLVSLPERKGGELPRELLRHLRFGDTGGGGSPRFVTSSIEARTSGNRWIFAIRCRRTRPDDSPWHVVVRLKYAVDGGAADDVHAITAISSEAATRAEIRKGDGYLEFPGSVKTAAIRGETSPDSLPAVGTRAAVQIRVDGQKGGLDGV